MNCISFHRIANFLYLRKVPLLPWLITKIGSQCKCAYGGIGVVVHGKAKIGRRFIIG